MHSQNISFYRIDYKRQKRQFKYSLVHGFVEMSKNLTIQIWK